MGWLECIFPGRQLIRVESGHDKSPVPPVSGLDLTPHFTPSIPGQFYLSAGGLLDSQIVSLEVVGPSYQDFPEHLICWGFLKKKCYSHCYQSWYSIEFLVPFTWHQRRRVLYNIQPLIDYAVNRAVIQTHLFYNGIVVSVVAPSSLHATLPSSCTRICAEYDVLKITSHPRFNLHVSSLPRCNKMVNRRLRNAS